MLFPDAREDPSAVKVPLGNKGIFAFVSPEDAYLAVNKWHSKPCYGNLIYAIRMTYGPEGRKGLLLHRAVLGVSDPSQIVDHINGNGLDCRRENLRIATTEENARNRDGVPRHNTSGMVGVSFKSATQKWAAQMRWGGKNHHLGYFSTAEQAHEARLVAERRIWGVEPRRARLHEAENGRD